MVNSAQRNKGQNILTIRRMRPGSSSHTLIQHESRNRTEATR